MDRGLRSMPSGPLRPKNWNRRNAWR